MPKLPLFKDEPLNQGIIIALEEIRDHPEIGDNAAILNDLAALHQNPESPMPERLVYFCVETSLVRPVRLEVFLINTLSRHKLRGIRARMQIEINQWLLVHANAAGLTLSVPPHDS